MASTEKNDGEDSPAVVWKLSNNEIKVLRLSGMSFAKIFAWLKVFEVFDPDQSGSISAEEIAQLFLDYGEDLEDKEDTDDLNEYFKGGPSPDGEEISFVEFALKLESIFKNEEESAEVLKTAFVLFLEKKKKKKITDKEIEDGLEVIKETISESDMKEFMKNKGNRKKGFAKLFLSDITLLDPSGKKKPVKKKGAKKKKKKEPVKAVSIDKNDPKYKKYFKIFEMRHIKAMALQRAQQDGLSKGEIAALDKMLQ
jgi:Ca2+-binding EF-hand superfamily protein